MSSANYIKQEHLGKLTDAVTDQRGTVKCKDKMSFIGGKVPANLSMHGSNTLRGGTKVFNAMCLNNNWYEDRLNPALKKDLDLFTAPDSRPPHAPHGRWATEYMTAYSKGDWHHEKVKVASTTIFAFDESGSRDWTSCYRHDYRNHHEEEEAIRKKCKDDQQKKADEAEERLNQAAEARKPEWPLTPDVLARIGAERDAAGDARSHHLRQYSDERSRQQEEHEGARKDERYGDDPNAGPRETSREAQRQVCYHTCAYHRPVSGREYSDDPATDSCRQVQGHNHGQEDCGITEQRKETVRFVDCLSAPRTS